MLARVSALAEFSHQVCDVEAETESFSTTKYHTHRILCVCVCDSCECVCKVPEFLGGHMAHFMPQASPYKQQHSVKVNLLPRNTGLVHTISSPTDCQQIPWWSEVSSSSSSASTETLHVITFPIEPGGENHRLTTVSWSLNQERNGREIIWKWFSSSKMAHF